jgi:hypothetical protein
VVNPYESPTIGPDPMLQRSQPRLRGLRLLLCVIEYLILLPVFLLTAGGIAVYLFLCVWIRVRLNSGKDLPACSAGIG